MLLQYYVKHHNILFYYHPTRLHCNRQVMTSHIMVDFGTVLERCADDTAVERHCWSIVIRQATWPRGIAVITVAVPPSTLACVETSKRIKLLLRDLNRLFVDDELNRFKTRWCRERPMICPVTRCLLWKQTNWIKSCWKWSLVSRVENSRQQVSDDFQSWMFFVALRCLKKNGKHS